jgi:hypothetical protein
MSKKRRRSKEEEFQYIPGDLPELVEWLRSRDPELGDYLESHIVVDEQTHTTCYTGDDRITFWGETGVKHLNPEANPPWPHPQPKSGN